jgi:two-component system cell cycle response regulator
MYDTSQWPPSVPRDETDSDAVTVGSGDDDPPTLPMAIYRPPEELARPRVLVGEDEATWRCLLESSLGQCGYDVLAVSDGESAWEALHGSDAPRIAVLDWNLPGADGLEICRRVRRQGAPAYIMLLTGSIPSPSMEAAESAGVDDWLTRPFDLAELDSRIRAGLRILDLQAQLARTRAELESQAARDPVTGLWNRAAALELLAAERARSRRDRRNFGLLLLQLDGWSALNESHGSATGDAILRGVGRRLTATLRPYSVIARHAADELLLVLPGAGAADLESVVGRIREVMGEAPFTVPAGPPMPVTCTLGALSAPWDWTAGQEALLRIAGEALDQARTAAPEGTAVITLRPPPRRW